MAIHLWKQDTPGGSWIELDVTGTLLAHSFKLTMNYNSPSQLSFALDKAQHERPIGARAGILFYDDSLSVGNSFADPAFEGHVLSATPGKDPNEVLYTCMDPTRRVAHETYVMSSAWQNTTPPIPGANAYPRICFNCNVDMDDDYAYSRTTQSTMGAILKIIFDDQLRPLRYHNAAPATGDPYTQAELDLFTWKPQEKMVFETMTVRRAIDSLMVWEPKYRYTWIPGTRKWRFDNLTSATEVTLTLNKPNEENQVLHLDLIRTTEGCCTAVKIYGPERPAQTLVDTVAGTLNQLNGITVETHLGSPIVAYREFQVANAAQRKLLRTLLVAEYVNVSAYFWTEIKVPILQAWFPGEGWPHPIWGTKLDTQRGIIKAPNVVTKYRESPPSGEPKHILPSKVQFLFAYLDVPFSVRYPTSGFSGTAYTVDNMQVEELLYDDMFAIGYENFQPVTTPEREAQFLKLAQQLQEGRRDVVYTGVVVLHGIKADFLRLNKRINIASVDANGTAIVTGWTGMYLTGVDYDFSEQTTTLTINGDKLELFGEDVEAMKARLKIVAMRQLIQTEYRVEPVPGGGVRITYSTNVSYVPESEIAGG